MARDRLFLKVFAISITIFLFLMILPFFITPIVSPSFIISIIYFSLGIITALISLRLFKLLRTNKEISMVNFLFEIKKFNEEIKVIYFSSLIFFVCWFYWGLTTWLWYEVNLPEMIKTILWYTEDLWVFSSLILPSLLFL